MVSVELALIIACLLILLWVGWSEKAAFSSYQEELAGRLLPAVHTAKNYSEFREAVGGDPVLYEEVQAQGTHLTRAQLAAALSRSPLGIPL